MITLSTCRGSAVLLLLVACFGVSCDNSTSRDVPVVETPGWVSGGFVSMRFEQVGSKTLLLRNNEQAPIYRVQPGSRTVSSVPRRVWDEADTPIQECLGSGPALPPGVSVNYREGVVRQDGSVVVTEGDLVLSLNVSPSGTRVAVLSADGPRSPSLVPFLGGGGASGRHYHQVFSLPEMKPLSTGVPLPFGSSSDTPEMCWSPDGRFAVYIDSSRTRLAVIATDLESFDEG